MPLLLAARLDGPDRDGNETIGKLGVYELMYGNLQRREHERIVVVPGYLAESVTQVIRRLFG